MAKGKRTQARLQRRGAQVPFVRDVYLPVQQFIRTEWIGSAVLLAAAILALLLANSPWSAAYAAFWHTHVDVTLGSFHVEADLHHVVNDGLMAIFFFVVGLEIKRELVRGALSSFRKAALPAVAAVGGMVVPALAYVAVVGGGEAVRGWGIPMATDIAFALGVLGVLGSRIPSSVRVFLLALAVVDDVGAILVIAIFYSGPIQWSALGAAAVVLAGIVVLQRLGIRTAAAYGLAGFLFWLAVYLSGVHATIAGVVLGFVTPSRPLFPPEDFGRSAKPLLDAYEAAVEAGHASAADAALGELEELTVGSEAPVERAERHFHSWSSLAILPLFALANAGVDLRGASLLSTLAEPVALGIVLGLVLGKLVGVGAAIWVAVRTGLAGLPEGAGWSHMVGVAALSGIGFTVSLFIAELAFVDATLVAPAKLGIIVASVLAGVLGFGLLFFGTRPAESVTRS